MAAELDEKLERESKVNRRSLMYLSVLRYFFSVDKS